MFPEFMEAEKLREKGQVLSTIPLLTRVHDVVQQVMGTNTAMDMVVRMELARAHHHCDQLQQAKDVLLVRLKKHDNNNAPAPDLLTASSYQLLSALCHDTGHYADAAVYANSSLVLCPDDKDNSEQNGIYGRGVSLLSLAQSHVDSFPPSSSHLIHIVETYFAARTSGSLFSPFRTAVLASLNNVGSVYYNQGLANELASQDAGCEPSTDINTPLSSAVNYYQYQKTPAMTMHSNVRTACTIWCMALQDIENSIAKLPEDTVVVSLYSFFYSPSHPTVWCT